MPFTPSRNYVLLLGAGSSAQLDLPVMAGFMNRARRRCAELQAVTGTPNEFLIAQYEAMLAFRRECENSAALFNRDWDNIEELYTQADLQRLCRQPNATERCDSIAWAIWDVYRRHGPCQNVSSWLQYVIDGLKLRPVVITTNYDVSIELGIMPPRVGGTIRFHYHYPGFQLVPTTAEFIKASPDVGLETERGDRDVPVIKLHGSVNWFSADKDWFVSTHIGDTQGSKMGVNDESFDVEFMRPKLPNSSADFRPAIIPPMLSKTSASEVIATQLECAVQALRLARHVTVLGYSFPPTDAFMLRLLSEGLRGNEDLEQFTVIDQRQYEGDWQRRIHEFFTPVARSTRVRFINLDSKTFWSGMFKTDNAQRVY